MAAGDAYDLNERICTDMAEFKPEDRANTVGYVSLDKEKWQVLDRSKRLLLAAAFNI